MKEKTLLLGNEAVARGLYEAGCKFVSSYPGTPSTEITEKAALYDEIFTEWAPNILLRMSRIRVIMRWQLNCRCLNRLIRTSA